MPSVTNAIAIHCANSGPLPIQRYPAQMGVPFGRGQLTSVSQLIMVDESGNLVPLQTAPLSSWPDGSIKWLLVDFFVELPPQAKTIYWLKFNQASLPYETQSIRCRKTPEAWFIDAGSAEFSVDTRTLKPFQHISLGASDGPEQQLSSEMHLCSADGIAAPASIDKLVCETVGPVRCTLVAEGYIPCGTGRKIRFAARLNFYNGTAKTSIEFRLHNPDAALHPKGLWDLGDPGSILFKECGFTFFLPQQQASCSWRLEPGSPWGKMNQAEKWRVYQESSGGDHWDSPNHRNRQGEVPLSFRGYRVSGSSGIVKEGNRAAPVLRYQLASGVVITAFIKNFWQKFPKAIGTGENWFHIGLFPAADLHELQGGEQVTNEIFIDFAADQNGTPLGCNENLSIHVDQSALADAAVFKDFAWEQNNSGFHKFLQRAFDEKKGFFAKREMIDEYGWRNFGEIYADHEAAQHRDTTLFISHYNNQYDPLYSFYRKFLTTGDERWRQLAVDLASHIADIDINHTEKDREEYNHGLFWHTDHYLDAGTATHRMASREHLQKKNPAFCGGGPGAEHCYTTGLSLHYLLTGDPRFRQLTLQLADWCYLSLRGPRTMLASLLRASKEWKIFLAGREKNRLWHRFPLTRGTGNCIKASLDALDISGDRRYLDRAAWLIRQTVHPRDPLGERDLLNAEVAWSYTVFLVSVGIFLTKKTEWNELDDDYAYACQCLLHYARWMVEHEYPYLQHKEILEFPEVTWAGQDLRKSVILYYAACHCEPQEREIFLNKCRFFLDEGLAVLNESEASFYTRPLVLVLQNSWVADKLTEACRSNKREAMSFSCTDNPPRLTLGNLLKRIMADMKEALRETNSSREQQWLTVRLKDR